MAETFQDTVLRGPLAEIAAAVIDPEHPYRPYQEVLVEGPANCGKSYGICYIVDLIATYYPGVRLLLLRQTRKSLTDSILVTFEDKCLGLGHPAISGTAGRANRHSYVYPQAENVMDGAVYSGRSEVVCAGLDTPGRALSTEWDAIFVFQAEEITYRAFQILKTRLRNKRWSWRPHPIFLDVNPAEEDSWINARAETEHMLRLLVRHKHNPGFTYDDQATLDALEGLERARLRDGLWVSRAGQIWFGWDRAIHMIDADDVPECDWFFGSFDQGTRHPGCFQVWGVKDDCLYRVEEVYRTGENIDWWSERVVEADEEYGLHFIVCDHEPDYIAKFNDFLATRRGEDSTACARNASKAILPGIAMVQWALSKDAQLEYPEEGLEGPPTQSKLGPRLFLVRDAFPQGLDQKRLNAKRPACTEQEIPSYTWILKDDGQPQPEKPDPTCSDHGCDAMRYAVMGYWKKDYKEPDKGWEPTPLSYADWAGVGVHEDDAL